MTPFLKIKYIRDILYIQNDDTLYNPKKKHIDDSFKHYPTYSILPENYLKKIEIELNSNSFNYDIKKKINREILKSLVY